MKFLKFNFCFMFLFISFLLNATVLAKNSSTQISSLDKIFGFNRIEYVTASPDGTQTAFVAFHANKSKKMGLVWEYDFYLKSSIGELKSLLKGKRVSQPSWSFDGNYIAYMTNNESNQTILWIYNFKQNQHTKILTLNKPITSFKWSPDGKTIAFFAQADSKSESKKLVPITIDENTISQKIYLIPIKSKDSKTKNPVKPIALTPDYENVANGQTSIQMFDWSPDSKSIAYAYTPIFVNVAYDANPHTKINIIDVETKKTKSLSYTEDHIGWSPSYSPDGKWLAFSSNLPPTPSSNETSLNKIIYYQKQICAYNFFSKETACFKNTYNQSPDLIGWNAASTGVFVMDFYKDKGTRIYLLDLNPANNPKLLSNVEGFIAPWTFSLNQNHTMFGFGYENVYEAPEAYVGSADGFKLQKISTFNDKIQKPKGNVEVINWKSKDGLKIEGVLVTPENYNPKKTYPLYVAVHGGPTRTSGLSNQYLGGCREFASFGFDPTVCLEDLLSMGFVVFQPNPRGGSGYGRDFMLANRANFGQGPIEDVMSGVDMLIKKGVANSKHLAISGWSYGGYLTAFTITQTNRFQAAIIGDGMTDLISFSGTTDIPFYTASYLGNSFWNDDTLYKKESAIFHTKNITTPSLIMTGENDVRVPPTQSYELYKALKIQNKPVKLVIFPKQGHVPSDANIIYESIKSIDSWLKNALPMQQVLDLFVQEYHSSNKFTGAALTVQCPAYNKGQAITFNTGLQSTDGVPVDNNSLFQIGSNTKSFVSVIILQLEAEGKLTIENKVGDFFPKEYPKWKNITIKQLLNMTSGIPNYSLPEQGSIWTMMQKDPYHLFTTEDLLNNVKNSNLLFTPGTGWDYSNSNYVLAGKIIEKITGKSLPEEMTNRIIKPLHMEHTFYITTFAKKNVPSHEIPHLMHGYFGFAELASKPYYTNGQDIIDYQLSWTNAAGALVSTISDLNTYGRALFSTDPKKRLLPQKQFAELITQVNATNGNPLPNGVNIDHPYGYGLGLLISYDKSLDAVLYGHTGGTSGFISFWNYIPKKDISYAYSINNNMPPTTLNSDLQDPLSHFLRQNCF